MSAWCLMGAQRSNVCMLGMFYLLAQFPLVEGAKSGGGMGGLYWAFVVIGVLVIGVIGFIVYQYWKRKRALERSHRESNAIKRNAIQQYEDEKLQEFHKNFQRDLELAAKKRSMKIDPSTQKAADFAKSGQRKEVFSMIDNGLVEVNTEDSYGRSLLMLGAEIGDSRLCDGLLRRGADINQRNKFNGATCLHFAYQYEHDSLGLSLVARGADDTIRAIDGRTCYQLHEEFDDGNEVQQLDIESPAPRRDMNAANASGARAKRKDAKSKGGTRRPSQSNYDKMGDRPETNDKTGDPYDQQTYAPQPYPPGLVPGNHGGGTYLN